jgi:hypothetical protein
MRFTEIDLFGVYVAPMAVHGGGVADHDRAAPRAAAVRRSSIRLGITAREGCRPNERANFRAAVGEASLDHLSHSGTAALRRPSTARSRCAR